MPLTSTSETLIYSDLADDPDLAEIVDMFVAEMPIRAAMMEARFAEQQWSELERAAHQIKGAAGSYGFNPLTTAAAKLEAALKGRADEAEIKQHLDILTQLCRSVRSGTPAQ